jgi:predicted helicase
VTEALRTLKLQADLFIIDEAHRNTSARASDSPRALWAEEAVIELPARRRLYMTATPRTWDAEADAEELTFPERRGEVRAGRLRAVL